MVFYIYQMINMFNIKILESDSSIFGCKLGLSEIQKRKIDGIILRNFIKPKELSGIQATIENSTNPISTIAPYGKIIGKKLMSNSGNFQEHPLDEYLNNSGIYRTEMASDIGFDFEGRFVKLCQALFDVKVEVPLVDGKSYIPAAVRCLFPKEEG